MRIYNYHNFHFWTDLEEVKIPMRKTEGKPNVTSIKYTFALKKLFGIVIVSGMPYTIPN